MMNGGVPSDEGGLGKPNNILESRLETVEDEDRPMPTPSFVALLLSPLVCFLFGGLFLYMLVQNTEAIEKDRLLFIILAVVSFFVGIIIVAIAIREIVKRLRWDRHNNTKPEEEALTTEQANLIQSHTARPRLHFDEVDRALGAQYRPKLVKDKYGNVSLKSRTSRSTFHSKDKAVKVLYTTIVVSLSGFLLFGLTNIALAMFGIAIPSEIIQIIIMTLMAVIVVAAIIMIIYYCVKYAIPAWKKTIEILFKK